MTVNVSGKWFNFVGYEVDRETERLDYDRIRDLAKELARRNVRAFAGVRSRSECPQEVPSHDRRGKESEERQEICNQRLL